LAIKESREAAERERLRAERRRYRADAERLVATLRAYPDLLVPVLMDLLAERIGKLMAEVIP
jgi:hypothetical protein